VPTTAPSEAIDPMTHYKQIFKQPLAYIKSKEPVFDGYENFTFNEVNYEITDKDIKWLESSGL
jgi:hypothetical protein